MPLAIDFEWERDQAGYRVVPAPAPDRWSIAVDVYRLDKTAVPPERQDQATRAGLDAGGAQLPDALIMRRGGELVRHRPLERVPGLFRVFAGRARTKEGLLDFVNQFGPLTEKGQDPEGEPVGIGLSDAAIMRQLLGCDSKQRASHLIRMGDDGLFLAAPVVWLARNPSSGSPTLTYKVNSLREALWLEFGQALSSGHSIRECMYCGELFELGPGATRQASAKFCSDAHRIAYNSQKRTKLPSQR